MKIRIVIWISILSSTLIGCDSTLEDFEKLNKAPEIKLKSDFGNNNNQDSLKIAEKTGAKIYTLQFVLRDEDPTTVKIETLTNNLGRFSNINKAEGTDSLYSVNYTPQTVGWHELKVIAIDRFNIANEVEFDLYAFENLLPIGDLKIEKISEDSYLSEYIFDASNSFDKDQKYGGTIQLYKYFIGEEEITLEDNQLQYVFPNNMTGIEVGLQVMDNDGVWSEKVKKEINL